VSKTSRSTKLLLLTLFYAVAGLLVMELVAQALFDSSLTGISMLDGRSKKGRRAVSRIEVVPVKSTMIVARSTDIRETPSFSGMKVGSLSPGAKIDVTGTTENEGASWYEIVRYGGSAGYVPHSSLRRK